MTKKKSKGKGKGKSERRKVAVPRLRFPGFEDSGNWVENSLVDICDINSPSDGLPETFIYIDLESVVSGRLCKKNIISKKDAPSRAQRLLKTGDVVYQMVRPYQRNNFILQENDSFAYVASTGYAQFSAHDSKLFLFYLVHTEQFVKKVMKRCTGSSYPAIKANDLSTISILSPRKGEQKKIADCLSSLDDLINAQDQKIELLKAHKKGLLQQLFPQEGELVPRLRFPGSKDSGDWHTYEISECIEYEQPTPYLVTNTKYNDAHTVPVLTAGKSFILGYTDEEIGIFAKNLPVIIFDDFTTAIKFVDFPFKVKSSALKILKGRDNFDIRFMYGVLQTIKYQVGAHQRHWISKFSSMNIKVPSYHEQKKIADCLSSLDDLINAQDQKIELLKAHKKGLLQQLFPSNIEG